MKSDSMTEDKPYEIKFDYREKYLFALVSGEKDALETSLMFWQDIIRECNEKNYKKILITEEFKNNISAIELFILGEKLTEMVSRSTSVAFVDKELQHLEMNKFTETVAINRGGRGRAFSDVKEAENWLLDQ